MFGNVREITNVDEIYLRPRPSLISNTFMNGAEPTYRGLKHDGSFKKDVVYGKLKVETDGQKYIVHTVGAGCYPEIHVESADKQMYWSYNLMGDMYENDVVIVFDRNTYRAYLGVTAIENDEEVIRPFCPTDKWVSFPLNDLTSRLFIRRIGAIYEGGVDPDRLMMLKFPYVGVQTPHSQFYCLLKARYLLLKQEITLTDFIQYLRVYNMNDGRAVSDIITANSIFGGDNNSVHSMGIPIADKDAIFGYSRDDI